MNARVVASGGTGADTFLVSAKAPTNKAEALLGVVLDYAAAQGDHLAVLGKGQLTVVSATAVSNVLAAQEAVLGEATARSLGLDPRRLQALLIAGVGLTVGAGVAVAGIIGFVGLVVPHLVRPLTDRRPSRLILPSALAGALLLLVADGLCRLLPLVTELRLGIALSLIGAPFFLWLLLRMRAAAPRDGGLG